MSAPDLSPAPWRPVDVTISTQLEPVVIRIMAADGSRVADVAVHPSIGGRGIERARANAEFICRQRLAL